MLLDELPAVEYRLVTDYPGYRVGDDGSVWSKQKNSGRAEVVDGWHQLAGGLDKDGYRKVILCCKGRRRYARVSVLVLETFTGFRPEGMTAAHNNGNKTDNRLTNLRWATQKDNVADKAAHGTAQIGEKHPQHLLTDEIVLEMRKLRREKWKLKDIAARFRANLVTVQAAVSGRNWKHLNEPGADPGGATKARETEVLWCNW